MSQPVSTHGRCPACGHNDCLSTWSNGNTYCQSCQTKTYGENMQEELDEELRPYRDLTLDTIKKYDVRTGVTEKGEEKYRVYKYPKGIKYRNLPKSFRTSSGFSLEQLFGMDKFNAGTSKHITVVEGEDDALAAYQMLGSKFPVVALPSATASIKGQAYDYLNSFKEIVVATDSDEAGEACAQRLAKVFPDKVTRVSMTKRKDAMEFLENNEPKDFLFAWHNRTQYKPEGVWNTSAEFIDILRSGSSYSYSPSPFVSFNDLCKGLVKGQLMIVLGQEGQGKTEVLRAFEYHMLENYPDVNIAVSHMEEDKRTCLHTYACYKLGKDVRDPDHTVPISDVEDAVKDITKNKNLFLFDHLDHQEPDEILETIRYLATVCNVEYFFIDPIQQLAYGREGEKEEQVLSRIAVKMEKMANDLNIGIILTAHVNDQGQTRSSRMIGKSASIRLELQRDHLNSDTDLRNTTHMTITKNRPFGKTGYCGSLVFDPKTFTIKESL